MYKMFRFNHLAKRNSNLIYQNKNNMNCVYYFKSIIYPSYRCLTSNVKFDKTENELEIVLDELDLCLSKKMSIGNLYKSLSQESKKKLSERKLALETLLIQNRSKFIITKHKNVLQVKKIKFKKVFNPNPLNLYKDLSHITLYEPSKNNKSDTKVLHSKHSTSLAKFINLAKQDETVSQRRVEKLKQKGQIPDHIYQVLKYIPNEWSAFNTLDIPDDIRENIMKKRAKAFLMQYPKYFEVKPQPVTSPTFEVRRSIVLQKFIAHQEFKQKQEEALKEKSVQSA